MRAISLLILLFGTCASAATPNVVLIFCDDLGYADIGPYGAKVSTPNLDRMAREGMRFTDLCVGQPVCSASRAALLTGCYPNRIGITGALPPNAKTGINSAELTMAEMFKSRGYATAIFGKWHLGDAPQFNPTRHGFDEYFGLPYSNDMWDKNPAHKGWPKLPLYENDKVIELDPDQRNLTTRYTEHAVRFIERNKDRPFFLYVPHTMPHVPLAVSDKFAGKSGHGLYGDVVQELDWSVGQILDTLSRLRLDENTLVIFTSDNGPWLLYGDHAGSAKPLREGKMTAFEGGMRVPCLMRWPAQIPQGAVCRELASSIDLLPTFANLIGAELPANRVIDGKNIVTLLRDPNAKGREVLFDYWNNDLRAVRSGTWKLHFPHTYPSPDPPGSGGSPGKTTKRQIDLALFDLANDPSETTNVAAQHPDVVERLSKLAEQSRNDLAKNTRPPGRREE